MYMAATASRIPAMAASEVVLALLPLMTVVLVRSKLQQLSA
jgi:hypothetical protein